MIAICKDNSYTWRDVLTAGKEYQVESRFIDPYAGYPMIKVMCDDGKARVYRENRFVLVS